MTSWLRLCLGRCNVIMFLCHRKTKTYYDTVLPVFIDRHCGIACS